MVERLVGLGHGAIVGDHGPLICLTQEGVRASSPPASSPASPPSPPHG
jgi:hypothetical protein